MTNQAIIEEITGKLKAARLRAYEWDAKTISAPAVLVGLPDRVQYRTAYSRRGRKLTFTIVVLVGSANARASSKKLMEYTESDGELSIFRLLDSEFTTYTTCDDVTIVDSENDVWSVAGNPYLGAEFTVEVTANGA